MSDDLKPVSIDMIHTSDDLWRVILTYADGEKYVSNEAYASAEKAEKAAQKWYLENCTEGRAN